MIEHDPLSVARIYAASDTGHGVWQMLDTGMDTAEWDSAFADAYRERFGEPPPPGTSLRQHSMRLAYDVDTYQEVYRAGNEAAHFKMMEHAVMVTEDCATFGEALGPAAAAVLETAFGGAPSGKT